MSKENDKIISEAFAKLLILMAESNTDNIEITFNFNKCKAKFKVDLLELEKMSRTKDYVDMMQKEIKELAKETKFPFEFATDEMRYESLCVIIEKYKNARQQIAELEEQLKEKDLAIDKFSKIDIWLMRKYGKKLYKDFNITNDDMDVKTLIKISEVFDKIYEEMNKEMPLMWFNYGFFSNSKSNKGE